jgi:hypothetical protein
MRGRFGLPCVVAAVLMAGGFAGEAKTQGGGQVTLSIVFDGDAGANQTSPISPAAGKISATGSYIIDLPQGVQLQSTAVTFRYRVQNASQWTTAAATLGANNTWSINLVGVMGPNTYECMARLSVTTRPGGSLEKDTPDVRTVSVQGQ